MQRHTTVDRRWRWLQTPSWKLWLLGGGGAFALCPHGAYAQQERRGVEEPRRERREGEREREEHRERDHEDEEERCTVEHLERCGPRCAPPRGIYPCNGRCVHVPSDAANCGACGFVCGRGLSCTAGLCLAASSPGVAGTQDPGPWTERGPFRGGRLSGIVASSKSASELFVSSPGGGVWHTTDNGAHWSDANGDATRSPLGDLSVMHLEWDRLVPGRLFAVTLSDLYGTTDAGLSWTRLSTSSGVPGFWQSPPGIDPHPFAQMRPAKAPGTRFVFWSRPGGGLSVSASVDGTITDEFDLFPGGRSNPDNEIAALAADDATGMLYVSTTASGPEGPHLYRSCPWTAAGAPSVVCPCASAVGSGTAKWCLVSNGLPGSPNGPQGSALGAHPIITWTGQAGHLAVALTDPETAVFTTNDGGDQWSPAGVNARGEVAPGITAAEPRDLVWAGVGSPDEQLFLGDLVPVSSRRGASGRSWQVPTPLGPLHPDIRCFYPDANLGYLWATSDGSSAVGDVFNIARWSWSVGNDPVPESIVGVPTSNMVSELASLSMPASATGISVNQAFYIAVAPRASSGRTFFMGTQDNNALCSNNLNVADDRLRWTAQGVAPTPDGFSVVLAPSRPSRAYARVTVFPAIYRSDNANADCAGVEWRNITDARFPLGVAPGVSQPTLWSREMLAVDPIDPDHFYLLRVEDLLISHDGGDSYVGISHLPGGAFPSTIMIQPIPFGTVAVGSNSGIFLSDDDARSWRQLGSIPPVRVLSLAWSPYPSGRGTWFYGSQQGLFRFGPAESDWVPLFGAGYAVSDLEVDPACPSRMYAAFGAIEGGLDAAQHRGGVIFSADGGGTWTSLTAGEQLHSAPIEDIEIDPFDPRTIYVASFGRGIWQYDAPGLPACRR